MQRQIPLVECHEKRNTHQRKPSILPTLQMVIHYFQFHQCVYVEKIGMVHNEILPKLINCNNVEIFSLQNQIKESHQDTTRQIQTIPTTIAFECMKNKMHMRTPKDDMTHAPSRAKIFNSGI